MSRASSGVPCRFGRLRAAAGALWVSAAVVAGPVVGQQSPSTETLRIFAASSLGTALPDALRGWSEANGVRLDWVFDASSRLAPQVVAGAPADVLVTADRAWMDWVLERGGIHGEAVLLARNQLVMVATAGAEGDAGGSGGGRPESDPRELASWPSGRILLAGENVPAGRYATEALRSLGHWGALEDRVLRGGSVRSVLESVVAGAVPLGIVYRSDAIVDSRTRIVFTFPDSLHGPIGYFAAVTARSERGELAGALVAALEEREVQEALVASGFTGAGPAPVGGPPAASNPEPVLPDPTRAIVLSLVVALAATVAALPFALFLGWILARREFPGRSVLAMLVLTPLVLPPVVTGFLLLSLLGGGSPVGRGLQGLGLDIPFTLLGAILAAAVVGVPLYVAAVRGAFEAVDPHLEEVAWTLGVRPRRTFLRVTLPLAAPGIAAGAILAFARALGEFGATVVLAGNLEGETRTIALAVYTLLEAPAGRSAIWILVGASLLLSGGALLGYEILSRRQRSRMEVRR